ncbi:MAG: two-component sensor histidine kinase [Asticcacaulis sp. 32-58-5]|nr:MAG: two-component sensor histidine kinase [Asticcacaulis sp. 32-58-5]
MKPDGWALKGGGHREGGPEASLDTSYASVEWAQRLYKLLTVTGYWSARILRRLRSFFTGLSGRLMIVSAVFVVAVEVLILIPSLASFQERWLIDRIRQAEIASLALDASSEKTVTEDLSRQLLTSAGAKYLAIQTKVRKGGELIEIIVPAEPLKQELKTYLGSMLRMSMTISLAAGFLVFVGLSIFIVRPIQNLTRVVATFKANPEDMTNAPKLSGRRDEIGHIEEELAAMQAEVRHALTSRARLAALGQAVSKINHDLRNMLTSAQMASDRLAASPDPMVAKALPRLERALDRALNLAQNVLNYGKSDEVAPQIQIVRLRDMAYAAAEDAGLGLTPKSPEPVRFALKASKGFHFDADPEHMHRLLVNLMRNARQAIERQPNRQIYDSVARKGPLGRVTLTATKTADDVILRLSDNGPGIPEKIREQLFRPFSATAQSDGTGLGLAIARELAQTHGGDVHLAQTGPDGTTFEIRLPLKH